MTAPLDRRKVVDRLISAARADERIVGLLDYGSSSEGRQDALSDVDAAVFVRDDDFAAFNAGWQGWAAQFGPLLLGFISPFDHPWAVYDAEPLPLRVDFDFHPESAIARLPEWPNSPLSAAAMVWYDGTGGYLTEQAERLVGKYLGPDDLHETFQRVCGGFWYYLLRTYAKLERGDLWSARFGFRYMIVGNLAALLRIESGAIGRWQAQEAVADLANQISPDRLRQFEACLSGDDAAGVRRSFANAARLGHDVRRSVATQHGWSWPEELSVRVVGLLQL